MSEQTKENVAAIRLRTASIAMDSAAFDLKAVGSPEAKARAKEMLGASRMARAWAKELDKIHRAQQRAKAKGERG